MLLQTILERVIPCLMDTDHMQYQIRDPKGFAGMLTYVAEYNGMPKWSFIRK